MVLSEYSFWPVFYDNQKSCNKVNFLSVLLVFGIIGIFPSSEILKKVSRKADKETAESAERRKIAHILSRFGVDFARPLFD